MSFYKKKASIIQISFGKHLIVVLISLTTTKLSMKDFFFALINKIPSAN